MTIADIDKNLTDQLPNAITLSATTFDGHPTLMALFQQYFPGTSAITIDKPSNYNFDSSQGTITFSGTGNGGPFDKMSITQVLIKMGSGLPQISISATGDNGWTLYPR